MSDNGIVRIWKPDEGWGVVDVDQIDGGIWVHFSAIEGRDFGVLAIGETVAVDWEDVEHPPYAAQATRVTTAGYVESSRSDSDSGILNSHLTIEWDKDRDK
ncbi:cold-shock protein [Curtobacterium flaccumfaciens]|uniref:cold-shock protein n=1 Tax=Curtobacterium flaccumfaciens TaxID=2035 RepID=UPI001267AB64|nr:cold shock domain-containing protein [Curtobacterium flaccumfaciens]